VHIEIQETMIPIDDEVKSACEILGFDPLYVANEGVFALFLPEDQIHKALMILHNHKTGIRASHIGTVKNTHEHGLLTLEIALGIVRVLDLLSGEQLPRIC
jgi:hydrogenase expression/formation protein HypE